MKTINTCYLNKALLLLLFSILLTFVQAGADFYDLLEVPKNAESSAIKKAFRKKSLEYHPDKNPGKPKTWNNLTHCFQVMNKQQKSLNRSTELKKYCLISKNAKFMISRAKKKSSDMNSKF